MLRLDERRLLGALDELAEIGALEGGGCARLALTDARTRPAAIWSSAGCARLDLAITESTPSATCSVSVAAAPKAPHRS